MSCGPSLSQSPTAGRPAAEPRVAAVPAGPVQRNKDPVVTKLPWAPRRSTAGQVGQGIPTLVVMPAESRAELEADPVVTQAPVVYKSFTAALPAQHFDANSSDHTAAGDSGKAAQPIAAVHVLPASDNIDGGRTIGGTHKAVGLAPACALRTLLPAVSPETIDALWMGLHEEVLGAEEARATQRPLAKGGCSIMGWARRLAARLVARL
eukprot:jgi/Ulvmu1/3507/UM162_0014.1